MEDNSRHSRLYLATKEEYKKLVNIDRAQLRDVVNRFRTAIDCAKDAGERRITWIDRFPKNCCDHVSQQLFIHLYQIGIRDIVLARATLSKNNNGLPEYHVWLEVSGTLIDITAEQFELGLPGVIVSDSSDWHNSLSIDQREIYGECYGRDQAAFFDELRSNHVTGKWYSVLCEWLATLAN